MTGASYCCAAGVIPSTDRDGGGKGVGLVEMIFFTSIPPMQIEAGGLGIWW